MPNQLEQLKKFSRLAIEQADIHSPGFFPASDAILDSHNLLEFIQHPERAQLLQSAINETRHERWSGNYEKTVIDQLTQNRLKQFSEKIPGHLSIETDIRLAFDTDGLIAQAEYWINNCRNLRVDPKRVFLKIPATWEGIRSLQSIERMGIKTNLVMVYSAIQAQAGAEAGASLLSIPVGPASDWFQRNEPEQFSEAYDPGVATASHIYTNLKYMGYSSQIMATELHRPQQVYGLVGCDCLALSPQLAQQLAKNELPLERTLEKPMETYEPPPSMSEKDFRWHLTMSTMADEKLAQNIRSLERQQYALEAFIKEQLSNI